MQYVRNLSDSVSTAWNSINPATLSGAIDVIVVEQEDGSLTCSPFHVRFGKFSLLRPYEKKVEFKVNGVKQPYSMKLGEGGEAFFVFETSETIPKSLQTSPLVSPASSPPFDALQSGQPQLQEPESLDLNDPVGKARSSSITRPPPTVLHSIGRDGLLTPRSTSPELSRGVPSTTDGSPQRPHSDTILPTAGRKLSSDDILRLAGRKPSSDDDSSEGDDPMYSERSHSPPPLAPAEALQRAINLSKELSAVNIPAHVTGTGDLMLDMAGFKDSDEDAIRAEVLARKVLSQELDGNYDIGALFGVDERGNLWIYSSEEAKDAAMKKAMESSLRGPPGMAIDAVSDPGYHSDSSDATASPSTSHHRRTESDLGQLALQTPPSSPGSPAAGDPNLNYAKTLRLTSDQLKALNLKAGENSMSFTVNRATCQAYMYLWKHETPVVISDIDGTITKSDALGHVLNMIGRDWTHAGVAKLYNDIVSNGYNIMYLTSRSVGQADSTRTYLAGIVQDGYRLPRGPTILSPDRTMAALRREIYLRKPHIFKMSTLRDIRSLYGPEGTPFSAGFGNRFTDQISYRTVDVPRTRIFTINSNAEVSLDLLSLNKMKLSYVNMGEVVDHYFPPVGTLVKGGGEDYTDFKYWRDTPLELDEFSASDTEDDDDAGDDGQDDDEYVEDDDEEEVGEGLGDSYISRNSVDDYGEGSMMGESYDEERMLGSMMMEDDYADDEEGELDEGEEYEDGEERLPTPVVGETVPGSSGEAGAAAHDVNAELMTGVKNLRMENK
ncbi:Lipin/Ned1/Smp2-domain-containing protein [Chaetomidium leptoderma]|uniref:Lipin/Ned1/Smp2-domain-containing protein n=1 Tax=Chaetomidium leptoderma TaxID=669021 RepID=A0AAN6VJ35_9PEZI|nr:Lipin/Ned1/Smp2-domain-containing protein [Chaetomidium leptoderma]